IRPARVMSRPQLLKDHVIVRLQLGRLAEGVDCLVIASCRVEHESHRTVSARSVRTKFKRLSILSPRLVDATEPAENQTQLTARVIVVGANGKSAMQFFNRLVVAAAAGQG